MVRKYCKLVKKHSSKDYSLLVQKVITLIDADLTADLRTATLMNSDLIIVLDKGRIVEMGNHASLMEIENGIYRRIYNVQMSDPDGEGASA